MAISWKTSLDKDLQGYSSLASNFSLPLISPNFYAAFKNDAPRC